MNLGIIAGFPRPPSLAYSLQVMADSPVLYWKFNESSGTTAIDSATGGLYPGTYTRDKLLMSGPGLISDSGTSLLLPAAKSTPISGVISTPSPINTADPWTITALVKPAGIPSQGAGYIFQLGRDGFGVPECYVLDDGAGTFKIIVGRSGVTAIITSATSWAYGTRLHIVVTRNGMSNINLRINGVNQGSAAYAFDAQTTALRVGMCAFSGANSNHMNGAIDNFAAFSTYISTSRTDAHYATL